VFRSEAPHRLAHNGILPLGRLGKGGLLRMNQTRGANPWHAHHLPRTTYSADFPPRRGGFQTLPYSSLAPAEPRLSFRHGPRISAGPAGLVRGIGKRRQAASGLWLVVGLLATTLHSGSLTARTPDLGQAGRPRPGKSGKAVGGLWLVACGSQPATCRNPYHAVPRPTFHFPHPTSWTLFTTYHVLPTAYHRSPSSPTNRHSR